MVLGPYHKDVKSNNILLNETLKAKITDYALSGLVPTLGTLGYLDQSICGFPLTDKSDVYDAFGVVFVGAAYIAKSY
ncbi:hypothetical protein Scep_021381 [Stephania cephalantha]|uniref:Protein kinase domain-containing protein n=1 Tax=Stephania cephalantha TaxID=152367 RepID=A0AAP0F8V9_9MAGN